MTKQKAIEFMAGFGRVKKTGDERYTYEGSMPSDLDEDEVVIVRKDDFDKMLKLEIGCLLASRIEMPKSFYEREQRANHIYNCVGCNLLPDTITVDGDKGESVLFLDRIFYSSDYRKYMFARWESVDEAEREVGERK